MAKSKFFFYLSLVFLLVTILAVLKPELLFFKSEFLYLALFLILVSFSWKYFLFLALIFLSLWRVSDFSAAELQVKKSFVFEETYHYQAKVLEANKRLADWQLVVEPSDLANFSGKILVFVPLYPEYQVNDILQITCKIFAPEKIISNGRSFSYDKYLAQSKIFAQCFRPQIKKLNQTSNLSSFLKLRQYFWQNLNIYLREPASSLAKAMLLDDRGELSKEVKNDFARTGLSHLIAISGSHLVIIIWLLEALLFAFGLSRQQIFYLIILTLFFYLALIGFPASAGRSVLMASVALIGPFLGRKVLSMNNLLLSVVVLSWLNPYALLYDIGFQLSFLAVLGLLSYSNYLQEKLSFLPSYFQETLAVTLAAQIFTWPLIVYNFQTFSVVTFLANLVLLPLFPPLLGFGLLTMIFGHWPIVYIFSWPLFLLFKLLVVTNHFLSSFSWSAYPVNFFNFPLFILSLSLIFIFTYYFKANKRIS